MKKTLLTSALLALTLLSGCAVVPYAPAYDAAPYPAPYYGARYYGPRYYAAPTVIVPVPLYGPRHHHRGGYR